MSQSYGRGKHQLHFKLYTQYLQTPLVEGIQTKTRHSTGGCSVFLEPLVEQQRHRGAFGVSAWRHLIHLFSLNRR